MSIDVKNTNWLKAIGDMPENRTYIHLSNLNGLTAKVAQEAIDATYGKGYARIHDHGTVLWGTHLHNVKKQNERKANADTN